jgi:hypothetical protein
MINYAFLMSLILLNQTRAGNSPPHESGQTTDTPVLSGEQDPPKGSQFPVYFEFYTPIPTLLPFPDHLIWNAAIVSRKNPPALV